MESKKKWSKPIVLFHWGLIFCVVMLFISAEVSIIGHQVFAYLLTCLLIWRVIYSFKAPKHEKLSSWLHSPKKVFLFFKTFLSHTEDENHNPASSWLMILLMLVLVVLLATGSLGLAYGEQEGLMSFIVGEKL